VFLFVFVCNVFLGGISTLSWWWWRRRRRERGREGGGEGGGFFGCNYD
jgi:hypothetical protein